jgi:serine/threonine protein kinase/Tol biopolymer transport system component
MSISPGQQLGSYEVLSLLGKGGMGEVYRARDSKLNREVAIKILPEEFSQDRERITRFHREARSIAALNHANIAAIYELTESQGIRFLVLELVEGETLAERLSRGALPIDESLTIAKQILEALEAAYEKGIVHRDLKPANVKITPEGKVKVLDFGLAKAREEVSPNVALSNSPTAGLGATTPGIIMGTAAYMSPEQAKGFSVDHRSDLFSFGCVFYEMLTGRQAFAGDSISEILASVLKTDADFSLLPSKLNPRIAILLRRCLEKNPKNRWHAAADLRIELESSMNAPAVPAVSGTVSGFGWKYAAVAIISLALLGVVAVDDVMQRKTRASEPRTVSRFSISVPLDALSNFLNRVIAISPDGTQIVYQTNGKLVLRSIADFDAKPIAGAEDTIATTTPTFSPDGRSIVYWSAARGSLMTIPTIGGTPLAIAPVSPIGLFGIDWKADGILFADGRALERVAGNGGPVTPVLRDLDPATFKSFPKILPGGRAILFSTLQKGRVQIAVQSLDSDKPTILTEPPVGTLTNIDVHYVPTGHLVYVLGGTLFAVPFDPKGLKLTGTPVPVIPGVRLASTNEAELSFSNNGTLIYVSGPQTATEQVDVALADRNGGVQPFKLPPRQYESIRVSADGKRVALGIEDAAESNIWLYDLTRPSAPNRLTFGGKNHFPVWSPDGQWIAFTSDREGDLGIYRQRADGSGVAERLTKPEKGVSHVPESWSLKGDVLLFRAEQGNSFSLWSLTVADKKVAPFGDVKSVNPTNATFSPDGKWVAYNMRDAGKTTDEIYVQPFPATGARYQLPISRDNHHAVWSRDGKQLFYVPGPGDFAVIPVTTSPTFTFGTPTTIPAVLENYAPSFPRQYDVMPDGKLIGLIPAGQSQSGTANVSTQINVVLNWFEELKQKSPTK